MSEKRIAQVEHIFQTQGPILHTKVLKSHGFCTKDINVLIQEGLITKIKTGYYCWSSTLPNLSDGFIAMSVIPDAVLCLYSAANHHDLTTVIPDAVYLTVPNKGVFPKKPIFPPVNLYRQIEPYYSLGIQEENTNMGILRVYDRERTVCDFFRNIDTMGTDVTLEVLKTYMQGNKRIQTLFEYTAILGIQHIIKPYVEALI